MLQAFEPTLSLSLTLDHRRSSTAIISPMGLLAVTSNNVLLGIVALEARIRVPALT